MKNLKIELLAPNLAEQVCRSITTTLPEWITLGQLSLPRLVCIKASCATA